MLHIYSKAKLAKSEVDFIAKEADEFREVRELDKLTVYILESDVNPEPKGLTTQLFFSYRRGILLVFFKRTSKRDKEKMAKEFRKVLEDEDKIFADFKDLLKLQSYEVQG